MIINGVELEDLDIYDLKVAKKFDEVLNNLQLVKEEVRGMNNVEGIRTLCTAIFEVFNTMFGEGTDKKVFGNKVNLMVCIKALEEFVLKMNEQKKELDRLMNKYSTNRATRRSKK
ncbi:DUF6673 family protein [Clostridium paraputrificum]|uniref:DUF6673 family protein n=1 Tax=Clostridium paraputrificum TaxID=29363 RepID=UPI0034A47CDB